MFENFIFNLTLKIQENKSNIIWWTWLIFDLFYLQKGIYYIINIIKFINIIKLL